MAPVTAVVRPIYRGREVWGSRASAWFACFVPPGLLPTSHIYAWLGFPERFRTFNISAVVGVPIAALASAPLLDGLTSSPRLARNRASRYPLGITAIGCARELSVSLGGLSAGATL